MVRHRQGESRLEYGPGNWRGKVFGPGSVSFGQVVQLGPPRQSVEFTYAILPIALIAPRISEALPAVVLIFAPTPLKPTYRHAGHLAIKDDASFALSLSRSTSLAISSLTCCPMSRWVVWRLSLSRLRNRMSRHRGPSAAGVSQPLRSHSHELAGSALGPTSRSQALRNSTLS